MFLGYANMSCQSLVLMLNVQSPHIAMWFHLAKNFPETSREIWTGIGMVSHQEGDVLCFDCPGGISLCRVYWLRGSH